MCIFEFVDKTFCHNILLIFWKLWKFDELTGHGYDGDDDNKDDDEDDNMCTSIRDASDELTSSRDLRLIEIKIYTKYLTVQSWAF